MREGDRSYPGTLRAIFEMARHSCSEYHAEELLAALTFFMKTGNLLKRRTLQQETECESPSFPSHRSLCFNPEFLDFHKERDEREKRGQSIFSIYLNAMTLPSSAERRSHHEVEGSYARCRTLLLS